MTPEEQNAVNVKQQTSNFLQNRMSAFKQWKEQTDLEYANQQSAKMEQDTMDLYQNSLAATDKEIQAQYNVASRGNLLAEMISNAAREKGYDLTGNASDIVGSYLQGFPDAYQPFMDFTHSNQDPEDFAIQMGWMEKPENNAGVANNVIGGVLDSVTGLPKLAAKGIADVIGWTAKQLGADEDRVNYLVNDFKNYMTNEASDIGQDKDSWTYKGTKLGADIIQTATGGGLAKNAVKGALKNAPIVAENVPLWTKAAVGAVEGAGDMALYDMISESELPSGQDLAIGGTLGVASPLLGAGAKAVKAATKKRAVTFAEDLLQNTNRMTKGEQSKFYQRFNQNVGKWLNDRGLKSGEDIVNYFTSSKRKVDDALGAIKGEFTSKELTSVLDDVVDFAIDTNSPQANRMIALAEKNAKGGLTMSEINEVKRYFEAHNKFNYLTKGTAKQAEKATNMDTALREWQFKVAEENGFSNLAELNKETAAAKEILNGVKKWEAGVAGNNPISLTDVIVAFGGGGLSPESMAMYLLKKEWEAPAVRSKIVDMLNWIGGHETITEKVADLDKIMAINKIKDQKALEKYVDDLYKEWGVGDTTPRLTEGIATDAKSGNWGGIEAGEKGFVTQNPTSPTYQEMGLGNIKEVNSLDNGGKGMYNTSNNLSTNQISNARATNYNGANGGSQEAIQGAGTQGYAGGSRGEMSNIGVNNGGSYTSQGPIRQVSDGQEMMNLTNKIKGARSSKSLFVDTHSPEEYASMKNFANGDVGVASISPNQRLVNVASSQKGAAQEPIFNAIEGGALGLDCYGDSLVRYYEKYGFEPVARVKRVDKFAPEGWNYEKDGRPYIYFMKHNGDDISTVRKMFAEDGYAHSTKASLKRLPLRDYGGADELLANRIQRDKKLAGKIRK